MTAVNEVRLDLIRPMGSVQDCQGDRVVGSDCQRRMGVCRSGLQFDTTINDWHTCLSGGRINASNPCSEYMFLDDTACNLASANLMKFSRMITRDLTLKGIVTRVVYGR